MQDARACATARPIPFPNGLRKENEKPTAPRDVPVDELWVCVGHRRVAVILAAERMR
jgi:hypothetical protein